VIARREAWLETIPVPPDLAFSDWYFNLKFGTAQTVLPLLVASLRYFVFNRKSVERPWRLPMALCYWLLGLPPAFVYHDHVITGAPGMGTNGTAGAYKAPWKIIVLRYNPFYAMSPTFTPITSAADVDAAEAAGNVFLPINPQGSNPDEIETGNVLICPVVSANA